MLVVCSIARLFLALAVGCSTFSCSIATCRIRWHNCMIGLKSVMIRPNHANKWHDFAEKKRLRQRSRYEVSSFFLSACGNPQDTKSCVFLQKRRLRQRSRQKTLFLIKKSACAVFTIQKMHCCTDIIAKCRIFNISKSIMQKNDMILLYMGAIMPLLSYSLPIGLHKGSF
jgi:hypothetical protein